MISMPSGRLAREMMVLASGRLEHEKIVLEASLLMSHCSSNSECIQCHQRISMTAIQQIKKTCCYQALPLGHGWVLSAVVVGTIDLLAGESKTHSHCAWRT